jgi:hypothetical protein
VETLQLESNSIPTERQKEDRRLRQLFNRAYRRAGLGWRVRSSRGRRTFYGRGGLYVDIRLGHYLVDDRTGFVVDCCLDLKEEYKKALTDSWNA